MESFYQRVASWKTGLILRGKYDQYSAGYNRREVEYSALGVPIIANYNLLLPSNCYILCEKPEDLKKAVDKAIQKRDELIHNAAIYYKTNFSQEGIRNNFLAAL